MQSHDCLRIVVQFVDHDGLFDSKLAGATAELGNKLVVVIVGHLSSQTNK